ncbi:MAG: efflux RND transporter permease subunit [Pseudomonadota bacterium]
MSASEEKKSQAVAAAAASGPSSRDDIASMSVRRPYLATVLNLLIIIAGLSALFGIEVRELPDVDRPVVTVRANFPGGSPETVDAEVTAKVESAVARVNGITELRSSSEEGNFRLRVVFRPSVDLIDAANDVREAVSRVQRQLPDGVENLFVVKADSDSSAIVRLAVFSETRAFDDLTRQVENDVIPALLSIDGVADVRIFGERERVLRVVVQPNRLAAYGLSIGDVVGVLENARFDVPAGSFKSDEQEVLVRANATVTDPRAIEALQIRDPVTLGDVAQVYFGPDDPESIVRLNGRSVINLGVIRRAKSNTVRISGDVAQTVGQLNDRLRGVSIETVTDDAIFIRGAISEVLTSLGLAILIVVIVIALFIGQWRPALVPAVAIPVSLIGTVAAIWLLGYSVNLVTLLALVLATGLVVDDSIVVLENIQRLRGQGMASRAAAVLGTRQVFFAVVATTATLVSVFLPISFLPSTAGRLFAEFGFVLAATVCISSFVALTIVPVLTSRLPDTMGEPGGQERKLAAMFSGFGRAVRSRYARTLDLLAGVPLVVVAALGGVLLAAWTVYGTLAEELVPKEDRGKIRVFMTGPDGVGLDYTDRQVEQVEDILRPLVESGVATGLFSITGRFDPNRGQVEAPLVDWSARERKEGDIVREVNAALSKIPGVRARAWRSNSLNLRGAGGGLRFALIGGDYEALARDAETLVVALEREERAVENMRVEFRATQPQLSLQIDRLRAADLDVPLDALASTIRALVDSDEVAELTVGDKRVPIVVQSASGAVTQPSDLRNLFVASRSGRLVSLSQVVTLTETAVAAELDRHAQRRAVEVFADTADGFALREAVAAVERVARAELGDDTGLIFLDEAAALNETASGVTITFLIALLIVFLVLVAQFESIASAIVVLLTVPFGLCAAIFALALTGTSLNIYSQIGILMLVGIMAKNAILLVEFADQLRAQGHSAWHAAREAATVRLRPIAMTMMSTILAGLPLIFGAGAGAEARASIGWVVFGGLGLAAASTLLLTPLLYGLISGARASRREEPASV